MSEDDEVYRLTPKGLLNILIRHQTPIDEAWDTFGNFVKNQAVLNGFQNGYPCLVFYEGGDCILLGRADDKDGNTEND